MSKPKIAVALNIDLSLKRYHELFQGIQEYAEQNTDWMLVLDHFPEKVLENCSSESYYAGVIGRIKYVAYEEIKRLNIPVVNTWGSNNIRDLTSVVVDFYEAGVISAKHLLKKGLRNFVNIDYVASRSAVDYFKGFMSVAKDYKCDVKKYLISSKTASSAESWHKFNEDFKQWVDDWSFPLGIFCSLSSIGPTITSRCFANNLRIPEDVAVISAGNDLSYCEGFHPTISSVEINYFKVGYESAKVLHDMLNGADFDQPVTMIKPSGLVARESTDSYHVKDDEIKLALRYIDSNFQNNINVIDVVGHVNVCRATLESRFQAAIGHRVFDEINRLRVSSARQHLLETDFAVKKISEISGFSSPHHFIRVFKKYTGQTPSEFRKNN